MNKKTKRMTTLVFGWIFILLGIAGIFLPFLQGFLFLFLGLYLLSHESIWARGLLNTIRQRHPGVYARFIKFWENNKQRFKKLFRKNNNLP